MLENKWKAKQEMTAADIEDALSVICRQLETNRGYFEKGEFPAAASVDTVYPKTPNYDWTEGFYTGMHWLAYEETKDEKFKETAMEHVESFYQRIVDKVNVNHHDMGFLYSLSCVAAYKLTGDETAKKAALLAADNLMERFQEKGSFFQAWGTLGAKDNYRLIIDCLLNMPILFWASEVTGDASYRDHAVRHIETTMKYAFRPDFSTYHTFYFDTETGEPLHGVTHQGYKNDSIWARGQAWGVYGSALSYMNTKESFYKDRFEKAAECFMEHLPEDLVPYWDFTFTDGSAEPRDSSASAVVACALLAMAELVPAETAEVYRGIAGRLVKALTEHCLNREGKPGMGVLLHGTYARASEFNTVKDGGVDECNTWGDYFYMEALVRLKRSWNPYW